MPAVPHVLALTGYNLAATGFHQGAPIVAFDIPQFAILTAGSPLTVGTFILPDNIGAYAFHSLQLWAVAASGTLVAATFDLKANAVSLLAAPVALVGVTAINLGILTPTAILRTTQRGDTVAAVRTLVLSQTVDSANAGTLAGRIQLNLLPTA